MALFRLNENFIDCQGNTRCIPERFCMNKQAYSENENGSVSKSMQEYEVLMDVKEIEVVPELNQIKSIYNHIRNILNLCKT